MEGTYI